MININGDHNLTSTQCFLCG